LKNQFKESIISSKRIKEKILVHLNVSDNTGLHLIEPFNLYITEQRESIIFMENSLKTDNLHIVITVSGVENYKRIRMNYPKLVETVYVLVADKNEVVPLKRNAVLFLEKEGLIVNEACKLMLESLSDYKTIIQSKWRYFGFIQSITKFHTLLQQIIREKSEDEKKLLNALKVLKEHPVLAKKVAEIVILHIHNSIHKPIRLMIFLKNV
jgi:hypothetical protein